MHSTNSIRSLLITNRHYLLGSTDRRRKESEMRKEGTLTTREEQVDGWVSVHAVLVANGDIGFDGAVNLDHDLLPGLFLPALGLVRLQHLSQLFANVIFGVFTKDKLDLVPDRQQSLT